MKKHFSILLFLAIIGLSLFGFTTMMTRDHASHNCVASMTEGADCSTISSHISVLRGFFSAVFSITILLIGYAVLTRFISWRALVMAPIAKTPFSRERKIIESIAYRPFLRWRTFHETRDR